MKTDEKAIEGFRAVEFMRKVRAEMNQEYLENREQYLENLKKAAEDFKKRKASHAQAQSTSETEG